jgi:endonuclease/exonuclease/phosphatase family metal-dependent hydrolase
MKFWLMTSMLMMYSMVNAQGLKVVNFNTMCDLCGKKQDHGSFKKRLDAIGDTINRHDPDLISLQEFRTKRQVAVRLPRRIEERYTQVFAKGPLLSYADPVLMVRKERFKVLASQGFWLGPNSPDFSFGWKFGIPRRVQLAFLKDLKTLQEFILVGTHFDNASANKFASARYLNQYLKQYQLPIIFAGDTNIRPSQEGYEFLLDDLFVDTYQGNFETVFFANGPYDRNDACNLSKAPTFPECRIDHVLLSKNAPWSVKSWGVDVYKYYGKKGFVSDHRAVVVDLE